MTGHYELGGRGAFVIGHIHEGIIKPGNSVLLPDGRTYWKVSAVEFLDNIPQRTHRNAVVFHERPSRDEVERAFPVGTYIEVYAGDND